MPPGEFERGVLSALAPSLSLAFAQISFPASCVLRVCQYEYWEPAESTNGSTAETRSSLSQVLIMILTGFAAGSDCDADLRKPGADSNLG